MQESKLPLTDEYSLYESDYSQEDYLNDIQGFVPPHNTDAEQAILGSILKNNELLYEIHQSISASDFYNIQHQIIYTAITDMISRNERADFITITEELAKLDNLEKIGGRLYLIEIINNIPSVSNISHYAEIVRSKSVMRQLYDVGQKISQLAYNPAKKLSKDILDEAEQLVFTIADQTQRAQSGLTPIKEALTTLNDKITKLYENPNQGITGLETGFYDLDKKTAGLQAGDLIIVAGRPAMGKTTFAMNIAEYAAVEKGKTVAIFSMEMPSDQLAARMVSSLAGIELTKLKTGRFEVEDWEKFAEVSNRLENSKIFIDETGGLTALEIKAKIRRLKRQYPNLALVVVDYLQLMPGSSRKIENRVLELGEISRTLKVLAKEINAPIIALSQLSRNVENRASKKPMMSDLRDSGAIEQDADIIIFMYREAYYNSGENVATEIDNTAEAIIAKHRNGPTGEVSLIFDGRFTKFLNPSNIDYYGYNKY